MYFSSTRTVVVLAILLHNVLAFTQNPDCPTPTFFKTLGTETNSEYGTVLTQSGDGNLYLAGRNGNKTFIQKTNQAGQAIWMREFATGPFESITPAQIFEDSEGMIVGCGTQTLFAGASRGFVFRYDPLANSFLWANRITSNNPTGAGILEKEPGGSFVYYQNRVVNDSINDTDMEVLELDRATGTILPAFARRYKHILFDEMRKMVVVGGSLYGLGHAGGRHNTNMGDARRLLLARFNPVSGEPIWAKLSHADTTAASDFISRDLAADADTLIAAYLVDDDVNNPLPPDNGPYLLHLQKTDLDGNIIWVKKYDLGIELVNITVVSDGYVLSGQGSFGQLHYVIKVNKNGDFKWGYKLLYDALVGINTSTFGTNQSVAVADSFYFTGYTHDGTAPNVSFLKVFSDGTMADSCGYVKIIDLNVMDVPNPVVTPIGLQQLISTATPTSVNVPWTANTLEEKLICPDCNVPDPCPQNNDFVVDINSITCSGGNVNMTFSICELDGGALPDLSITFYNGDPYTDSADKLGTYDYSSNTSDSCAMVQLNDLDNLFGPSAVQNGFQIFAVVNDWGIANTPFSPGDFPLTDLEECDYFNNVDSFTIQLPVAPTLHLGPDQIICANESIVLDAGPGFIKYQWSNGATTQSNTVSFAGQYRVTVTDACGFQQKDTALVQVTQLPLVLENGVYCPGKSVTIRGFTFDQPGTYQQTIPGLNGDCDTAATFFISELPYNERIEVVYICPFETVTINGVVYTDSGLVRDTVPSSSACDTIVFYFINQLPLPFRFYNFEICEGESVVFNGQAYTQAGSFTDTLYSSGFGCDTIAYVDISISTTPHAAQTIQFCPGTSVDIGGQTYTQPGEVMALIPSITGGCDTLVTYTLEWLPSPTRAETLAFCPGSSVEIGGQTYTQPGEVLVLIPSNAGGCDTLVNYTLEWLPSPARAETLAFCPGTSVVIGGQTYTQPGTATETIPGVNGTCDTLVTYTLLFAPLPTRTETLEFCQGGSITLNGQIYSQPTMVTITVSGAGNDCDTLLTYNLQYLTPPPSSMNVVCPPTITVATTPGTGPTVVNYNLPTIASNCVCPGTTLNLTSGMSSGSLFPVGNTQVCYAAADVCGSNANCCFLVTVREELPCDTKTNGCIQYDLLGITTDAQQRRTYRIRVTNNCASKLIYTAIQLPNGLSAVSPFNFSDYTSPDGRIYVVRNPNYTPFYSIRFKSTTDSIANGQSDVFEYTLPAQANPTHINITSRLVTQSFYAAHLNTFNCPIGITPSSNRDEDLAVTKNSGLSNLEGISLFPNPTNGELFADLSRWQGEGLHIQILDSRGLRVHSFTMNASGEAQQIPLSSQLPSGLYFLELVAESGEREVGRFVLE